MNIFNYNHHSSVTVITLAYTLRVSIFKCKKKLLDFYDDETAQEQHAHAIKDSKKMKRHLSKIVEALSNNFFMKYKHTRMARLGIIWVFPPGYLTYSNEYAHMKS